jgi:hypothetical protein
MYWTVILFVIGLAIAVSGLFGAWPGIIIGLVLAAGAVVFFVVSGRDTNGPQLVGASREPTGQVRGPASDTTTTPDGDTANERVGQA